MHPRRATAAVLALAVVAALTACAPSSADPVASQTATTPAVKPEQTPTALSVAPGEQPPQLFDGDCDAMLTLEEVSDATGSEGLTPWLSPASGYQPVLGAGGLACSWDGNGVDVRVAVFPTSEVTGAELPDSAMFLADDCAWYCTVVTEVGGFTVVTIHNDGESSHTKTAAMAARIAPVVAERAAAEGAPWVRDTSVWIDLDCLQLGVRAGDELGVPLDGENWGLYIDPLLPHGEMADYAARAGVCKLVDVSGQFVEVSSMSGAAWGGEAGDEPNGLPTPWTGHATEEGTRNDGVVGPGWVMSDGVNLVRLSPAPGEFAVDLETLAAAVAIALTP